MCYFESAFKAYCVQVWEDYGEAFERGHTVGAFLEFTEDTVTMTFTKNGQSQAREFLNKFDVFFLFKSKKASATNDCQITYCTYCTSAFFVLDSSVSIFIVLITVPIGRDGRNSVKTYLHFGGVRRFFYDY